MANVYSEAGKKSAGGVTAKGLRGKVRREQSEEISWKQIMEGWSSQGKGFMMSLKAMESPAGSDMMYSSDYGLKLKAGRSVRQLLSHPDDRWR